VVLDCLVDCAIRKASRRSAFFAALHTSKSVFLQPTSKHHSLKASENKNTSHRVASVAEVRDFWHHDTIVFNQIKAVEVVSIRARSYATLNATFFNTPQLVPASAFMSLVRFFT